MTVLAILGAALTLINLGLVLLGGRGAEAQPGKRGPTPKLQRQLEQLSQVPRSQQRFISETLDTVLQQTGR
jgi:hypothetical protein